MELIRDNWTKNDYDDFVEELRSYADEKYRSFHSSLIPDNDKDFFIGEADNHGQLCGRGD